MTPKLFTLKNVSPFWRYVSAVYAMALRLSFVCPSVCHKSEFCQNS